MRRRSDLLCRILRIRSFPKIEFDAIDFFLPTDLYDPMLSQMEGKVTSCVPIADSRVRLMDE